MEKITASLSGEVMGGRRPVSPLDFAAKEAAKPHLPIGVDGNRRPLTECSFRGWPSCACLIYTMGITIIVFPPRVVVRFQCSNICNRFETVLDR